MLLEFLTLQDYPDISCMRTDGLFVNSDAGFDFQSFINKYSEYRVITNTVLNSRNGSENENILFDDELYRHRYTIENTNAWLDSYRTILNRFEVITINWKSFNYIAFIVMLFEDINKKV